MQSIYYNSLKEQLKDQLVPINREQFKNIRIINNKDINLQKKINMQRIQFFCKGFSPQQQNKPIQTAKQAYIEDIQKEIDEKNTPHPLQKFHHKDLISTRITKNYIIIIIRLRIYKQQKDKKLYFMQITLFFSIIILLETYYSSINGDIVKRI